MYIHNILHIGYLYLQNILTSYYTLGVEIMTRKKKVEDEFIEATNSEDEEFDGFYTQSFIDELEENDEIDTIEQGFMEGYLEL